METDNLYVENPFWITGWGEGTSWVLHLGNYHSLAKISDSSTSPVHESPYKTTQNPEFPVLISYIIIISPPYLQRPLCNYVGHHYQDLREKIPEESWGRGHQVEQMFGLALLRAETSHTFDSQPGLILPSKTSGTQSSVGTRNAEDDFGRNRCLELSS